MSNIDFIREGFRNIKSVGSVSKSSSFVCKRMAKSISSQHKVILELGAGNGAITEEILKQMGPEARLLVFEINPSFCEQLRAFQDPRMVVVNESAEHARQILTEQDLQEADIVISAIPFLLFPKPEVNRFVKEFYSCLRPGGKYIQLHYSLNLKELYEEIFDEVKLRFVPINIPPAFIFECVKKS